jgi:hypothetical protein
MTIAVVLTSHRVCQLQFCVREAHACLAPVHLGAKHTRFAQCIDLLQKPGVAELAFAIYLHVPDTQVCGTYSCAATFGLVGHSLPCLRFVPTRVWLLPVFVVICL